jgi:hypothetical protein
MVLVAGDFFYNLVRASMSVVSKLAIETALTLDREKFELHTRKYWAEIKAGSSKKANAEERAISKVVEKYETNGNLVEFLAPFLAHESAALRLSSAARLLQSEARESAISILRELVITDPTLIAVSAGVILRVNDIAAT